MSSLRVFGFSMTSKVFFVAERLVALAFKWWIVLFAMLATEIALVKLLIVSLGESHT
jgi:hypothetical protein